MRECLGWRGRGLGHRGLFWGALCLAMGALLLGCKARQFGGTFRSEPGQGNVVLVHCMSPQGNGGNWAATLGWVASDFELVAQRAELMGQAGSKRVFVYPRCFSGGSSGSAATNVMMSLFENEKLFEATEGDVRRGAGFYTPDELRLLGRALRFLALSVDMNISEAVRFFGTLLGEQAQAQLQQATSRGQAKWWGTSFATAEGSVLDFGKVVHAARLLDRQTINAPLEVAFKSVRQVPFGLNSVNEWIVRALDQLGSMGSASSDSGGAVTSTLVSFAQSVGVKTVSDQLRFATLDAMDCSITKRDCVRGRIPAALAVARMGMSSRSIETSPSSQELSPRDRYARLFLIDALQSFYAGQVVDTLAQTDAAGQRVSAKNLSVESFNADFDPSREPIYPVTATLREAMDEGFLTLSTAAISLNENPQSSQSQRPFFNKVPNFLDDIRFVAFMSSGTSEAIQKSDLFQQDMQACVPASPLRGAPTACRFALAEVGSRVYSMLPSVREPGLMDELYAPAFLTNKGGSQHLGVERLFDAMWAQNGTAGQSSERAGASSGSRVVNFKENPNLGGSTYFAVAGGWPDRRLSAWVLMYYMDTLLGEDPTYGVKARFKTVVGAVPQVVGSVSLFGKPDRQADARRLDEGAEGDVFLAQKFDVNAVSTVFSGSMSSSAGSVPFLQEPSKQSRSTYLRMMSEFYRFFGESGASSTGSQSSLDRKGVPVTLTEVMNNWDLSTIPLPAFLPAGSDGGATRYLVALSHNSVSEGLLALAESVPEGSDGSDWRQVCSLSRFRRDFERTMRLGPIKVGSPRPKSDIYVDRIQCMRRVASAASLGVLKSSFGLSFGAELRSLSSTVTVAFNAIDPRIDLGRPDAKLVVVQADQEGNLIPAVVTDQEPEPTAEQKTLLQQPQM